MKSLNSRLTFAAVTLLIVALALPAMANRKRLAARQNANPPVLKIDGKENPDVYLQSLDVQVEVTGNIASTRYTMVFKNRTNLQLEGELTFPLPDGLTVTHYALDINGRMREAVPVEKARATQVFEEIQRREVDPGILERVEGNNFRTRIYPFPRNGTRTISIGYEEELALEDGLLRYRLPMAYPKLEQFSVKATVWMGSPEPLVPEGEDEIRFDKAGESYVATFARKNYQPPREFNFSLPVPADIPQVMMQSAQGSQYFLASVAPDMEARKKQWGDELAIIWDVSLSGTLRNLRREMEMLEIIFAEKQNADVHIYFLKNTFSKSVNGSTANGAFKVAGGKWDAVKKVLESAVFDGGTDFSRIDLQSIAGSEILFFSDGLSTLSDADFLKDTGAGRPIHCIVTSAQADYSAMRLISGKTGGKFVNANALSDDDLKNELLNETPQFLGVEHGGGVREVYPSIATPVYGNFSVAGISDTSEAELTLLFGFGDTVEKRIEIKLDANDAGTLGNIYRIWAQKKIAELDLDYGKNREVLTELGRQFGIVTRNTSLIVLELASDYIRFNIDPPQSEPELLEEYQRMKKFRVEQWRREEYSKLGTTISVAGGLRSWWRAGTSTARNEHLRSLLITDFDEIRRTGDSRPASTNTRQPAERVFSPPGALRCSCPICLEWRGDSRPQAGESRSGSRSRGLSMSRAKSSTSPRAFAFEASEIIGYLDSPTPVFIMDMNDPNEDFVGLDGPSMRNSSSASSGDSHSGSDDFDRPESETEGEQLTVTVKSVRRDREYLKRLTGNTEVDYKRYLRLRGDYANSPAYYFDMSEWFYMHGDREAALRVLTSIAELGLEDASLYRMLGYRFKEYGEHALQKHVFQKVVQWRPMEPQSYRDYALALADNGEAQAALDSLYALLTKPFSESINRRSAGIEEVVITEMNRLIAKNPELDISKIDEHLIMDIPVDIRVVINWNLDNTCVNLHVKDPTGAELKSGSGRSSIGGRMSTNNRSGYGPEQYLLKRAVNGKYYVSVNYFLAREFAAPGPVTVMVEIYTKYAGKEEQRQIVTLQLARPKEFRWGDNSNIVKIAEFEYVPPPEPTSTKHDNRTFDRQTNEYRSHYESGQLETVGFFKDGKRTGEWKWYYENGQLAASARFKEGRPDGVRREYYESGRLQAVLNFNNGTVHGKFERYYENGRLKSTGRFKNGRRAGQWKEFDERGRLIEKSRPIDN